MDRSQIIRRRWLVSQVGGLLKQGHEEGYVGAVPRRSQSILRWRLAWGLEYSNAIVLELMDWLLNAPRLLEVMQATTCHLRSEFRSDNRRRVLGKGSCLFIFNKLLSTEKRSGRANLLLKGHPYSQIILYVIGFLVIFWAIELIVWHLAIPRTLFKFLHFGCLPNSLTGSHLISIILPTLVYNIWEKCFIFPEKLFMHPKSWLLKGSFSFCWGWGLLLVERKWLRVAHGSF